MLMVISPAKTLDFDAPATTKKHSTPELLTESKKLAQELKKLSPAELSELMHISDKLGRLNFERYHAWKTPFTSDNAKQALLAFRGDVYTGLDADSFNARDFDFAQKHLRILSGLYGVLRPLDLIQPYRLEMGTKFANARGSNLYDFWGERITEVLNTQLKQLRSTELVNLASNEYFKAVRKGHLDAEIIEPVFKDYKGGKYKVVSFYAKKARGMMSAWAIKNHVTEAARLKEFAEDGYRYNRSMSSASQWVFIRDQH